jgi:hydroxymethylbilane synthase
MTHPDVARGHLHDLVAALAARADDAQTRRRVELERACSAAIGAGCLAPVAAHHDGELLRALIAAEDGSWVERASGVDPAAVAEQLTAAAAMRAA